MQVKASQALMRFTKAPGGDKEIKNFVKECRKTKDHEAERYCCSFEEMKDCGEVKNCKERSTKVKADKKNGEESFRKGTSEEIKECKEIKDKEVVAKRSMIAKRLWILKRAQLISMSLKLI